MWIWVDGVTERGGGSEKCLSPPICVMGDGNQAAEGGKERGSIISPLMSMGGAKTQAFIQGVRGALVFFIVQAGSWRGCRCVLQLLNHRERGAERKGAKSRDDAPVPEAGC